MKKINSTVKFLIALVLGLICAFVFKEKCAVLEPIGTIFLNLIKMLVIPLVMCSIITSVTGMKDINKLGRVGGRMMVLYVLTTAGAAALGLALAKVTHLGEGVVLAGESGEVVENTLSIGNLLINMIPSNIFSAMANFETLPCIVFSILFGISMIFVGETAEPVERTLRSATQILYKMVALVMKLAPIGCFALIASGIGQNGSEILGALAKMVVLTYVGCFLYMIILTGMAVTMGGIPLKEFLPRAFRVFATAFTSRSSAATLPTTITMAEELGVSPEIAEFSLPIGCTINMNGAALGLALKTMLASFVFARVLSPSEWVISILICTLSGIGMPGVPNSGTVFNIFMFTTLGFPQGALIGMFAGVENLEDMVQTALNVFGDLTCSTILNRAEKKHEAKVA